MPLIQRIFRDSEGNIKWKYTELKFKFPNQGKERFSISFSWITRKPDNHRELQKPL